MHTQSWPTWDEALLAEEEYTLVVQVNGKLRDSLSVSVDLSEEEIQSLALSRERIQRFTEGRQIVNVIHVPRRLVNVVAR